MRRCCFRKNNREIDSQIYEKIIFGKNTSLFLKKKSWNCQTKSMEKFLLKIREIASQICSLSFSCQNDNNEIVFELIFILRILLEPNQLFWHKILHLDLKSYVKLKMKTGFFKKNLKRIRPHTHPVPLIYIFRTAKFKECSLVLFLNEFLLAFFYI